MIYIINMLKFSKIQKSVDLIFHLRNVKYLTDSMRIVIYIILLFKRI